MQYQMAVRVHKLTQKAEARRVKEQDKHINRLKHTRFNNTSGSGTRGFSRDKSPYENTMSGSKGGSRRLPSYGKSSSTNKSRSKSKSKKPKSQSKYQTQSMVNLNNMNRI